MNDPIRKLPTPGYIPSGSDTLRATSAMCEVDGGSFLVAMFDLRPTGSYSVAGRFEGRSDFVEVGRFGLSPAAFTYLKIQMIQAERPTSATLASCLTSTR